MPDNIIDKKLYEQVKKLADSKFQSKTGVYKSSWIVREYKKRGGRYSGPKPKNTGLDRWFKEKWVDLNKPIKKNNKIIGYRDCGRTNKKDPYPLCRPSKRITPQTPKTYKEIDTKVINKVKKQKQKVKHKTNVKFL